MQKLKRSLAKDICERAVAYAKQSVGKSVPATFYEIPVPKELRSKENEHDM